MNRNQFTGYATISKSLFPDMETIGICTCLVNCNSAVVGLDD